MTRVRLDHQLIVARYYALKNMTAVAREIGCSREAVKIWLRHYGVQVSWPKGQAHLSAQKNIRSIVGAIYGDLLIIHIERLNESFVNRSTVLCRCRNCDKTAFYSLQRLRTMGNTMRCGWCSTGRIHRPGPGEARPSKALKQKLRGQFNPHLIVQEPPPPPKSTIDELWRRHELHLQRTQALIRAIPDGGLGPTLPTANDRARLSSPMRNYRKNK